MNKLLLSTLAAFTLVAPAQAAVLLPNLYAAEYCSLRDMGVDSLGARRAATDAALIEGTPIKVMRNGEQVDADVLQSVRATIQRCPQYF